MIPHHHTLKSFDDDADTATVELKLEERQIEINLLDDIGKTVHGAEVEGGFSRTVRLEVRKGVLKILVYPANTDDPIHYELGLEDHAPRLVE